MTHPLTSIDLFAGAGGLTEGLSGAGFKCLYANEIVPRHAETFSINHPNSLIETNDIRLIDAARVRSELGISRGELDLLAGGPPCQGFSVYAPIRSVSDDRNHLFREFLRFVEEFQPRAVLVENVPGLVSFQNGATLQAILCALEQFGYQANVKILYAPHFGVPQTRWRTIIIGLRGNSMNSLEAFPDPIYDAPLRVNFTSKFDGKNIIALPGKVKLQRYISTKQAIDDLPALNNGEIGDPVKPYSCLPQNPFQHLMRVGSNGVLNHEAAKLGEINLKRMAHIPPGGNWTNIPLELLPKGMKRARKSDHTKRYGRVLPDGLASTILTKCDPHWGAYFHYSQDRVFTVREAARIQTFKDSYQFFGSRVEQYEQVGNAVPPLLSLAIGKSIARAIRPEHAELHGSLNR